MLFTIKLYILITWIIIIIIIIIIHIKGVYYWKHRCVYIFTNYDYHMNKRMAILLWNRRIFKDICIFTCKSFFNSPCTFNIPKNKKENTTKFYR